jgi:hypothetical protein
MMSIISLMIQNRKAEIESRTPRASGDFQGHPRAKDGTMMLMHSPIANTTENNETTVATAVFKVHSNTNIPAKKRNSAICSNVDNAEIVWVHTTSARRRSGFASGVLVRDLMKVGSRYSYEATAL